MLQDQNESTASSSQQGNVSPGTTVDPDLRPIGRCYTQALAAQQALAALRAAQENVRVAVLALGDCRARAAADAGDFASANQSDFDMFTAGLFDIMNSATNDLENLLNRECSDCLTDEPTDKQTDITE